MLVLHPDLIEEVRNSSEDYVDEVFKQIVTDFSNNLFLIHNFDSKFDKVTWVDILTFGLFPNIKDKYTKSCDYVNALIDNISICQLDPEDPVVLLDKDKVEAMKQALIAHADARKKKALNKRTEKRIRALKIGAGVGVGIGAGIGIGLLIIVGVIAVIYLPAVSGAAVLGVLSTLALKFAIFAQFVIEWCSQNQETINNVIKVLLSSTSGFWSSGGPKNLSFL